MKSLLLSIACGLITITLFAQEYPMRTIAEVKANNSDGTPTLGDTRCELSGIVHGINLRPGGLQFVIIDEAGDGMTIFNANDDFGYAVTEGDEVVVQGNVGFFNGLTELIVEQNITVLSTGNDLAEAEVVTVLSEATESQLVLIEAVTLVDPAQWQTNGSFNVDVTNGTTTIQVRIDSDTDIAGTAAPQGTFNIAGLGGQFDPEPTYDMGYQLFPRYLEDIGAVFGGGEDQFPAYTIGAVSTTDADGQADSLGVKTTLRGIVYGVNLRPNALQFTIIDENNDGIGVFSGGENFGYTVTEGDEVAIEGEIAFFNGLIQINPSNITLLSSGNDLFDPSIVTTLDESTESQLVQINEVTLVDPTEWQDAGSFNVSVTDGTNTFTVRIDADVDIAGTVPPVGIFNLRGIGGQFDTDVPYDEGYQILPRYLQDLDFGLTTNRVDLSNDITFFPNPVVDQLFIQSNLVLDRIELFNNLGQRVWVQTSNLESIDMTNLPSGVYTINFHTKEDVWSSSLLK
ncbi:MAG: T9SS type A sorting domain-containing protein [Bacteroidota bacterium]